MVNISVLETGERSQYRTTGTETTLSIRSLHPDYTYTYSVASGTALGTGPFSVPRSIKMPEDSKQDLSSIHYYNTFSLTYMTISGAFAQSNLLSGLSESFQYSLILLNTMYLDNTSAPFTRA